MIRLPPKLAALLPEARANFPLAPLTTWGIGGPARWLWTPPSLEQAALVLRSAHELGIPVFYLGRGSNVLIADAGLPGLTFSLRRAFQELTFTATTVRAGAGVYLPYLAGAAARRGWTGLEFLIGIPGTVGAAVRLNAGIGSGREIGTLVQRLWVLTVAGDLRELAATDLSFGYRTSSLLRNQPDWLVVQVELQPQGEAPPATILATQRHLLAERRAKSPPEKLTCGSVFKNPPNAPPAGWLIEQAGCKGKTIGDAQVSLKHANFIVNRGRATAAQVKALISLVQEEVWKQFGIALEREVVYLPDDLLKPGAEQV